MIVRRPIAAARAVLFDANGVLYHRPRSAERIARFLAPFGLEALPASQVRRAVEREHVLAQSGRMSIGDYFAARVRAYGLDDAEAIALGVGLLLDDSADIELFPNTAGALTALRDSGISLAIVTDSVHPIATKLGWLSARGLSPDVFAAAVSSVEVGVCKPDPAIYLAALGRLGVEAADAAFVGHATDELEGAARVGLATIAFRPDDPTVKADAHIDDLRSLPGMWS